jgi:hypothetical protein
MSIGTSRPLRMAGANVYSGGPNTGGVPMRNEGELVCTVWSGGLLQLGSGSFVPVSHTANTNNATFWSGAGRLNWVNPHMPALGVAAAPQAIFYDAATPAQSGPVAQLAAAGARELYRTPRLALNLSGDIAAQVTPNGPYKVDAPFLSGLSVNAQSGVVGFTFCWTPETAQSVQ